MPRFTLRSLMAVMLLVAALLAIGVPFVVRSRREARERACANNLAQLWKMAIHWPMYHGGRERSFQPDRGGAFWIRLTWGEPPNKPPIIHPACFGKGGIFDCPVSASYPAPAEAEYRGPSGDPNGYAEEDPVGADHAGAHGAGAPIMILRKSADVWYYPEGDPMWRAAATKTQP